MRCAKYSRWPATARVALVKTTGPMRSYSLSWSRPLTSIGAEAGEQRAEVLGRYRLDRVGLVEYDGGVTRKHRRSGVSRRGGAQGQIGEEEMMVDDHYVGVRCLSPHAKDEAAIVVLALRSDALVRAGREIAPGSEVLRQVAQLGAVAGLRRLRPGRDAVENRRFLPHRKGRIAQEAIEAEQAEVVLAAFQERY